MCKKCYEKEYREGLCRACYEYAIWKGDIGPGKKLKELIKITNSPAGAKSGP